MDRKRMLAWMLILLFLGVPMLALITSETDGDLGDQGGGSTWANLSTAGFQEGSIFTNPTIATGAYHACAIAENGTLYCWGSNGYGQLGIGSTENQDSPVAVICPKARSRERLTWQRGVVQHLTKPISLLLGGQCVGPGRGLGPA